MCGLILIQYFGTSFFAIKRTKKCGIEGNLYGWIKDLGEIGLWAGFIHSCK